MKPRFSKRRGALFIEVLLGIFVLSLGAAAFFSLFPKMTRSERMAREESIAGQLSNRYIEQCQLLRPAEMNRTNLAQLGMIDSGSTTLPYTFNNVPLDEASGYSPARLLRNGQGSVNVENLTGGSKLVTVIISWTSASGKARTFTTATVLGSYR